MDARLGLLKNLAGTWEGQGFNLIARPDRQGGSPMFLELNQTFETLSFTPISSPIPNRGDVVDDIVLSGLTYQQKVVDLNTQGALHIEPGIWINITPPPDDQAPGTPPTPQNVARMGTIPHGNSLLAQGTAILVPSLPGGTFNPDQISSVNTAPFPTFQADGVTPSPVPAAGTLNPNFPHYNLSNLSAAAVNFRTPVGDAPAGQIPDEILGVPLQEIIIDPAKLLNVAISGQNIEKMVVINVCSVQNLQQEQPNPGNVTPPPPTLPIPTNAANPTVSDPNFGGSIGNIPFLQANANAVTVFATFWLETITDPSNPLEPFLQLQYVQTVFLNFPIVPATGPRVPFTWPHVSVATLRKVFGGQ